MQRSQGSNKQAANESNSTRKCSRWTPAEDRALITTINDLLEMGGCKADNGQFKNGTWAKVEAIMLRKLPGCDKKAKPHIESRVKLLRRHYDAIAEMLSPNASGFGWNDEGKFVTCPQSVWDDWVKSHPNATSLRNKPFPFFDELGRIFGKDRAMGNEAISTLDALEELEEEGKDIEAEQVYDLTTEDEHESDSAERRMKVTSEEKQTIQSNVEEEMEFEETETQDSQDQFQEKEPSKKPKMNKWMKRTEKKIFDHNNVSLRLKDSNIQITEEDVFDVLGIPYGGHSIMLASGDKYQKRTE
ncbi:hypothetical protein AgCh_031980 [Apium graveolens]